MTSRSTKLLLGNVDMFPLEKKLVIIFTDIRNICQNVGGKITDLSKSLVFFSVCRKKIQIPRNIFRLTVIYVGIPEQILVLLKIFLDSGNYAITKRAKSVKKYVSIFFSDIPKKHR